MCCGGAVLQALPPFLFPVGLWWAFLVLGGVVVPDKVERGFLVLPNAKFRLANP